MPNFTQNPKPEKPLIKILLAGPSGGGKTTALKFLAEKFKPYVCTPLIAPFISLARTPGVCELVELLAIKPLSTQPLAPVLHLMTLHPHAVELGPEAPYLVLKNLQGILWMIPSSHETFCLETTRKLMGGLNQTLADMKQPMENLAQVFVYTHLDHAGASKDSPEKTMKRLDKLLNPVGASYLCACPPQGLGITEALDKVAALLQRTPLSH
jgi:hypothetical protein